MKHYIKHILLACLLMSFSAPPALAETKKTISKKTVSTKKATKKKTSTKLAKKTTTKKKKKASKKKAKSKKKTTSKKRVVARKPISKLERAKKAIPAKRLFGMVLSKAELKTRSIGFYTRGCLSGGKRLPVDGAAWQAMRLSRNRNWGHPKLIDMIERFAAQVKQHDGWPGLLVGDLSQPRGGPMLSGHRSHQIGLDADIWLNPMPKKRFSDKQRELTSAVSMLDKTGLKVNPNVWTKSHFNVIKRATQFKEVQRVLVHPAIKKALCEAAGDDKGWLHKVRPWWGHHYHMHIRLKCQDKSCKPQNATPAGDGCGKQLDHWFTLLRRPHKPRCVAGRVVLKNKTFVCTCPKSLKMVSLGGKGNAKCVKEDGTIPKAKFVKKNLNWMPAACRTVLKAGQTPLFKSLLMPVAIELPRRKAVAAILAKADSLETKDQSPMDKLIKKTEDKTIKSLIEETAK